MKQRCYNQTADRYEYYGKRGICICDAWLEDFNTFYKWALSHGYEDGLTIDRINLDGDYEPSNCKWSTMKEQLNHRRNTIYIEHSGETHTISEWSDILGVPQYVIRNRINRGWPTERVLNGEVRNYVYKI